MTLQGKHRLGADGEAVRTTELEVLLTASRAHRPAPPRLASYRECIVLISLLQKSPATLITQDQIPGCKRQATTPL